MTATTGESTVYTHRELAVSCYNAVWKYLDKKDRSADDEETMVHLCHSSFWHWTQVETVTKQNYSIGYWQLARVHAVIGEGETALRYADRCVAVGHEAELAPFYIGYGYEARARAYRVLRMPEEADAARREALAYAGLVADEEHQSWLLKDLEILA
ncbi:hypothetical protein ACFFSY_28585 [Paenibacillus aurantiacus]|uniref:Uncharacterized protein n=1 Tax=Paenibacillus aurantiacus TaxID=1936118 RepID=A0ABV5L0R4_9BACL